MTLESKLQALVAEWPHTHEKLYVEGYQGNRNPPCHRCELEALLAERQEPPVVAEGQGGELTEERAQDLARSYLYGAMGHLGISELKDEAVKSVASRLRADFAAAAPSLHKEEPECECDENRCYGPITGYRCRAESSAALHKEGAGGDTGLWRCPYCNIDLRASEGIGDNYGNISHPACLAKVLLLMSISLCCYGLYCAYHMKAFIGSGHYWSNPWFYKAHASLFAVIALRVLYDWRAGRAEEKEPVKPAGRAT